MAYNRVGLTSFFEHRKVENLYLNPLSWVRTPALFPFRLESAGPEGLTLPHLVRRYRRRSSELPPRHQGHRNPPHKESHRMFRRERNRV